MKTCQKCNKNFPFRISIDNKVRNLGSRKFCLECSPFGQHNTIDITRYSKTERHCFRCKQTLTKNNFYSRRGIAGMSVYCKVCTKNDTIRRQRTFKQKCVEYKGGKCSICGYSKNICALEFHHMDQKSKEFSISQSRLWTFSELTKTELDKCQLLCANCHREIHYSS